MEGLSGPAQNCLFPFFPSLSLPSKLPSICPPFHSLFIFLFPPCQSSRLKTLSCQFSPPNMLFILLFYHPDSSPLLSPFYSSSLNHVPLFLFSNFPFLILIIIILFYLPSLPLSSLLHLSFQPPSSLFQIIHTLHSASFPLLSSHHLFSGSLFLHSFGHRLL